MHFDPHLKNYFHFNEIFYESSAISNGKLWVFSNFSKIQMKRIIFHWLFYRKVGNNCKHLKKMERKAPWWDFSMRSSGKRMGSVSHWNIVFHFLVLFITSFPFETNLRLNSKVNWQWKGTFFWDMKWIRLNVIFTVTNTLTLGTNTYRSSHTV